MTSCGVPSEGTPSSQWPSAPHRWHVVTLFSSWMDFDLFGVPRSRLLPPFLQTLFGAVACCNFFLASRSPIIASYSALSLVAYHRSCSSDSPHLSVAPTHHRRRGCESQHQPCSIVSGVRSSRSRRSSRTSSLRLAKMVRWIAFFTDSPVFPSATNRVLANSFSEKVDVW